MSSSDLKWLARHPHLRHAHRTSTGHADHLGRPEAQIEAHAFHERPAIIDRDHHRLPIVRIYHQEPRPKGKCAVRRCEPVRIETLTTRGMASASVVRGLDAHALATWALRQRTGREESQNTRE